jgi:hypothetical protein
MFDPYHKWLGIPPEKQPATYYQLLGIQPEETDREVIEEAAIRQSTHLRSYQLGPHGALCTRVLNEIAAAKTVLLNPTKRSAYDEQLAKKHGVQAGHVTPATGQGITSAKPAAATARAAPAVSKDEDDFEHRPRSRPRRGHNDIALRRDWFATKVLVGALALLMAPILIVGGLYLVLQNRMAPPAEAGGNVLVMRNDIQPRKDQAVPQPAPGNPQPAPPGPALAQPNPPPVAQPKQPPQQKPAQKIDSGLILAEDTQKLFRNPILSADGRRAAFTSGDGQVHFWDLDAKKEIARGALRGGNGEWAISANGQFLAIPDNDAFEVWNMQTGQKLQTIPHPLPIRSIALSPDGNTVATGAGEVDVGPDGKQRLVNGVTAFKDCELRLWDVASGKMTRKWSAHDSIITVIHLTADRVLSSGGLGSVHEVDLATGKEKRSKDNRVIRQNFSPDGARLLGTLQDNRTIVLMDSASRQILRQFASPQPTPQVKWSQNGKFALTTDTNNLITVWDVGNGLSLKSFAGPQVPSIAISGDGRLALVGGMGSIRLLNLN